MREYFDDQLKEANPETQKSIQLMIDNRRQNMSGKGLDAFKEYISSKVGQRGVFFLLEKDSTIEVIRIWEDELNNLSEYEFVEMRNKMPKFKKKKRRLSK